MTEEIVIELVTYQYNTFLSLIIVVALFASCLLLAVGTHIRSMDDSTVSKIVSYILMGKSIIVFGIAGYLFFGGFYL